MSRRRGFTLMEILVGITFLSTLSYFLYTLVMMTARRGAAGDKKLQSTRAAMDVAGRIRRDLKWATAITLDPKGTRALLEGPNGAKRLWIFDPTSRELKLPGVVDPTSLVRYDLACFRTVQFFRIPGTPLVKYVVSAMPMEAAGTPSAADVKFSTTVAGEVCLRREQGLAQNPYWNGH